MANIEDKVSRLVDEFLEGHKYPKKIKKKRAEGLYETVQRSINGSSEASYAEAKGLVRQALRERKYQSSGNNYIFQETPKYPAITTIEQQNL